MLDRDHVDSILRASHTYYGIGAESSRDERLNPTTRDFIASQFEPGMEVLDIGSGNGLTLLEHAEKFAHGVGIDNDPAHLQLAEANRARFAISNVSFVETPSIEIPRRFPRDSFDFVFSERGPLAGSDINTQAALAVLRTNGLLFCETIGERHHREVKEAFEEGPRANDGVTVLSQVMTSLVRSGVELRVTADIVHKRLFEDVYSWLEFQCDIWAYGGSRPAAAEDLNALGRFAERNSTADGRIEITHHVVWAGGVKMAERANYWEPDFYPATLAR